ncbi:MAG: hypothetical protein LBQ43_04460 [Holosporales bacterium]|nr:hypothetical protein [Holosporales bacterium]
MTKLGKCLLFILTLTGSTKVDARIEVRSYVADGEFDLFFGRNFSDGTNISDKIPGKFSLFWGSAFINSDFLRKLRFFGHVNMSNQKPLDGVAALLKKLFPNTRNELVARKIHEYNSNEEEIRTLAALLVKAELVRLFLALQGNRNDKEFKKELGKKLRDGSDPGFSDYMNAIFFATPLSSFFNGKDKLQSAARKLHDEGKLPKEVLDIIFTKDTELGQLKKAILDESKYGYADRTVENIILAHISERLNSVDEAISFYEIYSQYRDVVFSGGYNARAVSQDVNRPAKLVYSYFTSTDAPYTNPVSNGSCPAWILDGGKIKGTNHIFADCVETSIRHIFNFIADQNFIESCREGDQPFGDLRDRVRCEFKEEDLLQADRVHELELFYAKNKNDRLNSNEANVRGDWNKVVFGFGKDANDVEYNDKRLNNLKSGITNIVKVMCSVLGIKYSALIGHDDVESLDPKTSEDLNRLNIAGFKRLLAIVNPDNTYEVTFNEKYDLDHGEIVVTITNREGKSYSITLTYQPCHGAAITPEIPNIATQYEGFSEEEIKLLGFVCPKCSSSPYHKIFATGNSTQTSGEIAFNYARNTYDENQRQSLRRVTNNVLSSDENVFITCGFFQDIRGPLKPWIYDISWCSSLKNLKVTNIDSDASEIVLPTNLKTLEISDRYPVSDNLALPESLESFSVAYNGDMDKIALPKSLKTLSITNECTSSSKLALPESLKSLSIVYKGETDKIVLPKSLKTLSINGECLVNRHLALPNLESLKIKYSGDIGDIISKMGTKLTDLEITGTILCSGDVKIPDSVKHLTIGDSSSFLGKLYLSKSLESLTIGSDGHFNELNFDGVTELKEFRCGSECRFSNKVVVPECLKSLEMGYNNNFVSGLVSSESLVYLDLGQNCLFKDLDLEKSTKLRELNLKGCVLGKITIPTTIETLSIGNDSKFECDLVFPESLERMYMGHVCEFKGLNFEKSTQLTELNFGQKCRFSGSIVMPSNLKSLRMSFNNRFECDLVFPESLETLSRQCGCEFKGLNFEKSTQLTELSLGENCTFAGQITMPNSLKSLQIGDKNRFEFDLVFPESLETLSRPVGCEFKGLNFEKSTQLTGLNFGEYCIFAGQITVPTTLKQLITGHHNRFEYDLVFPESLETLFYPVECEFKGLNFEKSTQLTELNFGQNCIFAGQITMPTFLKYLQIGNKNRFEYDLVFPESLEILPYPSECKFKGLNFKKSTQLTELNFGENCIFAGQITMPTTLKKLTTGYKNRFEYDLVFPESLETLSILTKMGSNCKFNGLNLKKSTKLTELNFGQNCTFARQVTMPTTIKDLNTGTNNKFECDLVFPESLEKIRLGYECEFKGLDFSESTKLEGLYISCKSLGEITLPKNLEGLEIGKGQIFEHELVFPESLKHLRINLNNEFNGLNFDKANQLAMLSFQVYKSRTSDMEKPTIVNRFATLFGDGSTLPRSIKSLALCDENQFNELNLDKMTKLEHLCLGEGSTFLGKVTMPQNLDSLTIGNDNTFQYELELPQNLRTANIGTNCKFNGLKVSESTKLTMLTE